MNGIDALKAKFADVELKANARTMEEVVAYIEENWGCISCEDHRKRADGAL